MIQGFRICFETIFIVPLDGFTVDLDLLKQIVLARNRDQHPDDLTTMRVAHPHKDRSKHPKPFFARQEELALYTGSEEPSPLMSLPVHLSREQLKAAIDEVEKIAVWLDGVIEDWRRR